jgi:hypothetical protein
VEKDITSLAWLADAPLFLDSQQVTAFYDAVVLPETQEGKITLSTKSLESATTTSKDGKTVGLEIGGLLKFFSLKGAISTEKGFGSVSSGEAGKTIELHPVSTPHRQLLHLALHYALEIPERLLIVSKPDINEWRESAWISAVPRGLVFVDFPPGSKFIPVAAELSGGKVSLYYDRTKEGAPPYPEASSELNDNGKLQALRREYWQWHIANFSALGATSLVEQEAAKQIDDKVGGTGRLRWIDYRTPVNDAGDTVHLHVSGRESYDTGVFAYNLIKRGATHGLRVVGTMKSGPDMNVLAIFER